MGYTSLNSSLNGLVIVGGEHMPEPLLDFRWPVLVGGHHWVRGYKQKWGVGGKDEPVLVEQPGGKEAKYYRPLRTETGLFKIFAEVPATEEAILGFVNRYGLLGGEDPFWVAKSAAPSSHLSRTREGPAGPEVLAFGDSFIFWVQELDAMRDTVSLWELIRDQDEAGLQQRIRWMDSSVVSWEFEGGGATSLDLASLGTTRADRARRDPLITPARIFVLQTIEAGLEGRTCLRLIDNPQGEVK